MAEEDKLQRWADLEMIAELRRLHDADCVQLDVWMGAPVRQLDAAHLIPRLLTLAEQGVRSLKAPSDGDSNG